MAGQTGLQPILARQLPFWDRLTPRERALVLERSGMVHYDPGQNIRGRSMECVGTLLVQQGSLRIYLLSDEGRDRLPRRPRGNLHSGGRLRPGRHRL